MKKALKTISLLAVTSILIASCNQTQSSGEDLPGITKEFKDSVSYAIGASLGSMVQQADFGDINMDQVYQAIEDVLAEKELKVEMAEANQIITRYLGKRQEALSTVNKEASKKIP